MRGFVNHLVYSVWITLGAVLQVCMTYRLLRTYPLLDSLLLVTAGGTYMAYNVAKLRQILQIMIHNGPKCNNSGDILAIVELFIFLFAAVVASYGFGHLHLFEQIWVFLSAIIAIGYSIPLWPTTVNGSKNRYCLPFRRIKTLKTHLVALIWTISTALLPALHIGEPAASLALWLIVVARYLFVFALTLPFDIRDMELDQRMGMQTLPLKIGVERTMNLAKVCLILDAFFITLHYLFLSYRPITWLMMLISFGACMYFSKGVQRQKSLWYYTFALDGLFVWQAIGILLAPR